MPLIISEFRFEVWEREERASFLASVPSRTIRGFYGSSENGFRMGIDFILKLLTFAHLSSCVSKPMVVSQQPSSTKNTSIVKGMLSSYRVSFNKSQTISHLFCRKTKRLCLETPVNRKKFRKKYEPICLLTSQKLTHSIWEGVGSGRTASCLQRLGN